MSVGYQYNLLGDGSPTIGYFSFDNPASPTTITIANADANSVLLFPIPMPPDSGHARILVFQFYVSNVLAISCWIDLSSEVLGSGETTYNVSHFITNSNVTDPDISLFLVIFERPGTTAIQTITETGIYTPTTNMRSCTVELIGGGGAGGSCSAAVATMSAGAGGGGGGAYMKKDFDAATIESSQLITIGAGGVPGEGSTTGTDGGATTFGSLLTAAGGSAGTSTDPLATWQIVNGGNGGIASGGLLNVSGGRGSNGWSNGVLASCGGNGGNTILGSGGPGAGLYGPGFSASGYGSGGGGSACNIGINGTASSGSAGAPGIVIITEHIK